MNNLQTQSLTDYRNMILELSALKVLFQTSQCLIICIVDMIVYP